MKYPDVICSDCGKKYGKRSCGIATWYLDNCGVCGKYTSVTEPRDFGHLQDGWQYETKESVCEYCNGSGEGDVDGNICSYCNGMGTNKRDV